MPAQPISNVPVVFGAMLFGNMVTEPEAASKLLDAFQKHGHSEVDTARMYAGGRSEQMLGSFGWQGRGLKVSTKVFPTKGKNMTWLTPDELTHSPADVRTAFNLSLQALKADKIDIYYLHAPDHSVPFEDTLREINKIHSEGKFERFGLSNYSAADVAKICDICKQNSWVKPSVYQGIYNAQHRVVEDELIPCLRDNNISFYVYNPLAGGFLTSRYTRGQTEFPDVDRFNPALPFAAPQRARFWNDANFNAIELLRAAIAPHGITESEAALRWLAHHSVLKKKFGDAVILGPRGLKHLEENLDDLDKGPLPADVVEALEAGWKETKTLPLTYSM